MGKLLTMLTVWLVRFAHVLCAALWVGGYAFLYLSDGLPARRHSRSLSYFGTFTMVFGLLLVHLTRGYAHFGHGEWGGIVASALLLSVGMMGLSDGKLRRAAEPAQARRWAFWCLMLGVLALAFMTRAPYAH